MTELTIALNFVIIFLLITAIVYGMKLNKRINLIRESGRELANLFRSFDDTILKAQNGIEDLKKVSNTISDGLQKKIDNAAMVMDELSFVSERALKVSEKISDVISSKNSANKLAASNSNVSAMPLVTTPPIPSQSMVPPKQIKVKKNLTELLQQAGGADEQKQPKQNAAIKANVKPVAQQAQIRNDLDKKQFSIASALKALGYGE